MSPGEQAYARVRHLMNREWSELTDDERANWEHGAALPPATGTLKLPQGPDTKVG